MSYVMSPPVPCNYDSDTIDVAGSQLLAIDWIQGKGALFP